MSKHIEVLARGVCVVDGMVLLCHTKGAANTYLPGGHVEFREPARVSLRREVREELGVAAKVGRFLGAVEHTFKQKGRRHCEINLVFEMQCPALSPKRSPRSKEDYIEFQWVPIQKLFRSGLEPFPLCALLPRWLEPAAPDRWASTF